MKKVLFYFLTKCANLLTSVIVYGEGINKKSTMLLDLH